MQDCNNDGVTDCEDYARLHFHGKDGCAKSIKNLNFGKRFETCRPVSSFPNGILNYVIEIRTIFNFYYKRMNWVFLRVRQRMKTKVGNTPSMNLWIPNSQDKENLWSGVNFIR